MASFVFFVVALAAGVTIESWLDPERRIGAFERWAFAALLGLAAVGFAILFFSVLFRALDSGVLVGVGLWFCCLALTWRSLAGALRTWVLDVRSGLREALRYPLQSIVRVALRGFLALLVIFMAVMAMRWDGEGLPQSSFMGWGDGAYHLDIVNFFLHSSTFSLEQPIAAGAGFKYPFLADFLSALVARLGAAFAFAWHAPTLVAGVAMVLALCGFARAVLKKEHLAFAFVFLVLVGGGLGFAWFWGQVTHDAQSVGWIEALASNIQNPKFEYTHLDVRTSGKPESEQSDANIAWIVPLVSFFSHQRTFILGAGIGALLLYGLWLYRGARFRWRWFLLFGFLPLAHPHTFLALAIVAGIWMVYDHFWIGLGDARERKEFLVAAGTATMLAVPQSIFLLTVRGAGGEAIVPWFGWTMCTHAQSWLTCDSGVPAIDHNVLWFWLKNFGLVFVLWLVASVALWRTRKDLQPFVVASMVIFAIANLVKLQPWEFDNNKILFWWWVLAILIGLHFFTDGQESVSPTQKSKSKGQNEKAKLKTFAKCAALLLFVFFASFSGILDVWARLQYGFAVIPNKTHFGYYGVPEKTVAAWIAEHTAPQDAFLTNSQPTQFVPMLTGRPIFLGYNGWLWSFGYNRLIQERQRQIRAFLADGNARTLCGAGVRYWLVDNDFEKEYGASWQQNPAAWNATQSVFSFQDQWRHWDIRKLDCSRR